MNLMMSLIQDVKYGLRNLIKRPIFSVVVVLTLSIGIGFNTAVFSVVNALLFRPSPFAESDRLVGVYDYQPQEFLKYVNLSYADFKDVREQSTSFAGLASYSLSAFALESGDSSEFVTGEVVGGNFFGVLGVKAVRGRTFTSDEEDPAAARAVAILSYNAWGRRFGKKDDVVGKTVRLNGHQLTIIGVASPEFKGMLRGIAVDFWVPMGMYSSLFPQDLEWSGRKNRWLSAVGRLRPEVSRQSAQAELQTIGRRLEAAYPETDKGHAVALLPLSEIKVMPGIDTVLYMTSTALMVVVGFILVIVCANLASMMLASATNRTREMTVRMVLGAQRKRIVRQVLTESLLLSLLGAALALVFTFVTNHLLNSIRLPLPVELALDVAVDLRVFVFALAISALTAVLFGLGPALSVSRQNFSAALKEEGRSTSISRKKRRWQNSLVVGQVALSLILLICSGLSVRSMQNAYRVSPGFDPTHVATATFDISLLGYDQARGEQYYQDLTERIGRLPGVTAVSRSTNIPLSLQIRTHRIIDDAHASRPTREWPQVDTTSVSPEYFPTMGIPMVKGRGFSTSDTATARPVVVVNQTFAKHFWPDGDAMGKVIRFAEDEKKYEIIGVAQDSKYRTLGESPLPYVYSNLLQNYVGFQTVLARTGGNPAGVLSSMREQARILDERTPVMNVRSLKDATNVVLGLPAIFAELFGLFGLLGLIISCVGIYGVLAFTVSQRTQEMGIRMALGARREQILKFVLRQSLIVTGIGIGIGILGALAATRVLAVILYGISSHDLATFVFVPLLYITIATLASAPPAVRAANADPLRALHHE